MSKIMESIVRDAILGHMLKNNLLAGEQHGFVPARNCITQLLLCLEDWTNMIEKGESFDVIYTDFAKAFDSVAQERLIVKIESLGFTGDILEWIKSFLKNRKQCVKVAGKLSQWNEVLSGVPQGSVIGPILFIIFINDMPKEVQMNICKLFADDCKLYGTVLSDGENKLQKDLQTLEKWSTKWQLPFNATKCKVMHFGTSNPKHSYIINNHILEKSKKEKDLGVTIDTDLKFHEHTAAAIKKGNQILGLIKKSYRTRDSLTIPTLYKSLVRRHLEYGNPIWGPFYQGDIDKLEAVQRRATKMVADQNNKPYEERLKNLDLPSLTHRRKRGDIIQVFKIVNGLVNINAKSLFMPTNSSRTRGHAHKFFKHHAIKRPRIDSFSQRIVNTWNSLPAYVINAPSMNQFKNRLDRHWKDIRYVTKAQ